MHQDPQACTALHSIKSDVLHYCEQAAMRNHPVATAPALGAMIKAHSLADEHHKAQSFKAM